MYNTNQNCNDKDNIFKQLDSELKQLNFLHLLEAYLQTNNKLSKKFKNELHKIKTASQENTLKALNKIKKRDAK